MKLTMLSGNVEDRRYRPDPTKKQNKFSPLDLAQIKMIEDLENNPTLKKYDKLNVKDDKGLVAAAVPTDDYRKDYNTSLEMTLRDLLKGKKSKYAGTMISGVDPLSQTQRASMSRIDRR